MGLGDKSKIRSLHETAQPTTKTKMITDMDEKRNDRFIDNLVP